MKSVSRHFLIVPLIAGLGMLASACAVPVAVTAGSYAADGALYVSTEKTSTDHFVSMVSKKDCAILRILRGADFCREREGDHDPYDVNYNEAYRAPSEGGMQYGPPLRPAADAPAASWDAAAYMPAEAPSPKAEPTTVVADGAPAAEPIVPPAPDKSATARRVRKPSRGRVASVP